MSGEGLACARVRWPRRSVATYSSPGACTVRQEIGSVRGHVSSRLRTLILHAGGTGRKNTLSYHGDWFEAFLDSPLYDVDAVDIERTECAPRVQERIVASDAIILLHSVNRTPEAIAAFRKYESPLDRRRGTLISFVGDEVNLPNAPLRDKLSMLKRLGCEFIATQLPIAAGKWLYAECSKSEVVAMPHALNPKVFRPLKRDSDRRIDIGGISVRYYGYLGDNERDGLYRYFQKHARDLGLKTELRLVSTSTQRLTRGEWASFLNDCRGTVSTEAGSYYLERDDATVMKILEYCTRRARTEGSHVVAGDSLANRIIRGMPRGLYEVYLRLKPAILRILNGAGIRTASQVVEDEALVVEIYERFYRDRVRTATYSKAISSRHFEAAGTQTCQIMFEGTYNGILTADVHYLALRKDFSNVEDVIARFRDGECRRRIVGQAFEHVMRNHTYQRRVEQIYALVTRSR